MNKQDGHYIVTLEIDSQPRNLVAWHTANKFYLAGSHTPYSSSHFKAISKTPLNLEGAELVKGTLW